MYCCNMMFFFSFQAIVLCFRLHFTKDNITNNTAAATVRQVVTVVFERVVAEDERYKGGHAAYSACCYLPAFLTHIRCFSFR